jgi:hypothetical protein
MKNIQLLNPENLSFTDNVYHVQLGHYLSFDCAIAADNEQDAIDIMIDSFHPVECQGYFLDTDGMSEDELEQYICGGNNCLYLSFGYDELRITKIDSYKLFLEC